MGLNSRLKFYPCLLDNVCLVNETDNSFSCADGYTGAGANDNRQKDQLPLVLTPSSCFLCVFTPYHASQVHCVQCARKALAKQTSVALSVDLKASAGSCSLASCCSSLHSLGYGNVPSPFLLRCPIYTFSLMCLCAPLSPIRLPWFESSV